MNIALIMRWDHEQAPGGDIDQIQALGDALRKQGRRGVLPDSGILVVHAPLPRKSSTYPSSGMTA